MAHQLTQEQIDEAAAAKAAAEEPVVEEHLAPEQAPYTTLAYGAEGDEVAKLVNLLAVLGHDTNNVIKSGGTAKLDESVLVDLRAAQLELGAEEPELTEATEIPVGVKGELVGQGTWHALYEAAAAKLENEELAPSSSTSDAGGAPAGEGSPSSSA